jgi:hypothetical protein
LCEALDWKQANGALRDVVCSGLLLERAGEIELPALHCQIRGQCRTARSRPEAVLIETAPLTMPLAALGAIEIQPVRRTADEPLFHSLMEQFYLETFIDPERLRGTCYRAANWMALGRTTGRAKDDRTHRVNRSSKEVLGLPVIRRFRELLQQE